MNPEHVKKFEEWFGAGLLRDERPWTFAKADGAYKQTQVSLSFKAFSAGLDAAQDHSLNALGAIHNMALAGDDQ
jgi:hypothetical protein